tara:strand:+ start:111 stop:278 length:168 start_codon:yes stop_codon:yes gene_type:complete
MNLTSDKILKLQAKVEASLNKTYELQQKLAQIEANLYRNQSQKVYKIAKALLKMS